jgi:hypothetical protein
MSQICQKSNSINCGNISDRVLQHNERISRMLRIIEVKQSAFCSFCKDYIILLTSNTVSKSLVDYDIAE